MPTTLISEWDKYGRMARVRIDNDANEKLDKIADSLEGTKSGLASEAIRRFVDQVQDEEQTDLD